MENFSRPGLQIYDWKLFNRDVRRSVRNCVLFLFFFFGVYFVAADIASYFVILAHTGAQGSLANPDTLTEMGELLPGAGGTDIPPSSADPIAQASGLISIISIIAGSLVFLICRKRRFFTDLALPAAEPLTPKIFIILIIATQAIQYVYGLVIMLVDMLLPGGLSLANNYDAAMDSLVSPIGILYIVLIGPIFEELIFRGAVMGSLRRYGDNFAILFSSMLFGFYHMVILQIPFALVLGLLLGYVAARWSLRASIALHIVVNGLAMLFSSVGNEYAISALGLTMVACTILTVVFLINWRATFSMRIHASAAYYPRTYANGFSSIAFWIYLVIMTASGVLMMRVM